MNGVIAAVKSQKGLTLIELIISVAILGLLIAAAAPMLSWSFTFMEAAKREEATLESRKLAGAIVDFTRNRDGVSRGRLPAPASYTAGGTTIKSGLYDPTATTAEDLALAERLRSTGVPVGRINNDAAAVRNVRVYQRVAGLTQDMPLYATTGPRVRLTYDMGVLYTTLCPIASACNTAATAANPPGDSAQLTLTNVGSWEPAGQDYGAIGFSTLEEQKTLLKVTAGRLNSLSDRLVSDFHNKIRLAAADSTQNFFPTNGGSLTLGPLNPAVNMGCRDGWYNLAAANVDILTQLGMDKAEHGRTAWGGIIDFCRDYDPALTGSHNAPPHYAALRINVDVMSAVAPTTISNAVIVTF